MEFDLLTTRPLQVTESASRDDIHHAMQRLRSRGPWNDVGAPKSDIIEEIDDGFIHHREHYSRLVGGGARGISSVRMVVGEGLCDVVVEGSREWDPTSHAYSAKISFQNYRTISSAVALSEDGPRLTWGDRARMLLEDNVRVDCSCKAFQYYYRHTATIKGFALIPEAAPSPDTNPHGRGSVCKHLEHALRYLGANYSTIASAMKREAQESTMSPIVKKLNDVLGESSDYTRVHVYSTARDDGKPGHHPQVEAHAHNVGAGVLRVPTKSPSTAHSIYKMKNEHVAHFVTQTSRAPGHKTHVESSADEAAGHAELSRDAVGTASNGSVRTGHLRLGESALTNPVSGGVISDIDALIAACQAKGFAKTISSLRMARAQAGLEGAAGPVK